MPRRFVSHWALRLLILFGLALIALLWVRPGSALEVPPLEGRVNDRAGLLSTQTERALTERLAAFENKTGHQFAILTIPSLAGDPLEDYSIRVVEAWKLGRARHDDGILILVVPNDRKARIEVGYGLEGALPDALAGRIVKDIMAPRFRRGDYEGGILSAVDAVLQATGGEGATARGVPGPGAPTQSGPVGWLRGIAGLLLVILFFPLILLLSVLNRIFGRRGGGMFYGGGWGDGDGWGGGGSDGGGFSGGGGGFGGGGASGDW